MDTIINITRNRNTYVIDLDTGKHITAYLEEPFRIVGVSGKELSSRPKQISERIGDAFLVLFWDIVILFIVNTLIALSACPIFLSRLKFLLWTVCSFMTGR